MVMAVDATEFISTLTFSFLSLEDKGFKFITLESNSIINIWLVCLDCSDETKSE